MKKRFKLVDLDCANCAAKMEDAIKKVDGVKDATVSFVMQKMTVEADDARFDDIMKEIVKVCKRVEPDCEIVSVLPSWSRCVPILRFVIPPVPPALLFPLC